MIHIANESLLFVFEFSKNKLIFWPCDGEQKQKLDKPSNDSIAPPRGKINSILFFDKLLQSQIYWL